MALKYEDVLEILRIIDLSSLKEIHLEYGDFKLVVRKRDACGESSATPPILPLSVTHPTDRTLEAVALTHIDGPAAPSAATPTSPPTPTCIAIRAPTAGTFYQAPAPGAEPFVRVGDSVRPGQSLCIVDVMKVMTTLTPPCAGTVVEICVVDAQAVAHDEVLMWLEPA